MGKAQGYTEHEARLKAASLRIIHKTDEIVAEENGDFWVVARYENNTRYVLCKPEWRAVD